MGKISREEWVIRVATRIVGTKMGDGFVKADDVVSDILLKLLDAGGFNWEQNEIEDFCRKEASWVVRKYLSRRERNECEFTSDDGEPVLIEHIAGATAPNQDQYVDAMSAIGRLAALPHQQRRALTILCGGGNPVDVAEEMAVTPWAAITLIKEARNYMSRVDAVEQEKRATEAKRAAKRDAMPAAKAAKVQQDWTNEEIVMLKAYWAEGYSGSEIGKVLGRGRCAVLGKVNRLGLTRPPQKAAA